MNIDIFIRTYKKDFSILKYSIIYILKFVKSNDVQEIPSKQL